MNPSYLPVLKKICQDVRREMANKSIEDNDIEWDVNTEVLFFYAMMGHKPVGVNKHFMMLLIHNKFTSFLNHQLSSKVLWDHLDTMYDMPSLHDSEIIPFPNEEVDFELPEECHDLLFSKHGVSLKQFNAEKESKSYMSLKSSKKHGTPKFRQSSTPVATTKSSFVTPPSTVNKAHKSHAIVKTESKTPATYAGVKFRQEFGVTVKATKLKHSPSLYGSKYSKFESPSVSKEESQDVSSKKKIEKGCSTATAKKPLKVESATASSISKKLLKTEGNGNGSKVVKTEASVSSQKKDYSSRKAKGPQPIDNAYCKKKVENVNAVKKRNESENAPKKMHESTGLKHTKSDIKTSSQSHKGQELETPPSVGSRKSSPVVKAKIESNKKPSRIKSDESVKKVAVVDSAKKVAVADSAKRVSITESAKKVAITDSAKKVTATDSAKKVAGTSKRRRQ